MSLDEEQQEQTEQPSETPETASPPAPSTDASSDATDASEPAAEGPVPSEQAAPPSAAAEKPAEDEETRASTGDAERPGGRAERGGGDGGRGGFRRRKVCAFCVEGAKSIDYKDPMKFRRYVSDRARIEPRRKTGTCAKHQRWLSVALKRARHLALLPYTPEHIRLTGVFASRR